MDEAETIKEVINGFVKYFKNKTNVFYFLNWTAD